MPFVIDNTRLIAMSTIYDVAKLANVSAMTVSRALNDPDKVRPASRKRIEEAIAQLGYKKNQAARALVTKTTGIVKIVMAESLEMQDPYFTSLFAGISDALSEKSIAQMVVKDASSHIKCDGMIVMGIKADQKVELAEFPSPVVIFGKVSEKADWVDVNNTHGSYIATKHLIDLGHKRIAFFKFDSDEPFIGEREAGYRHAMTEAGLPVEDNWIITGFANNVVSAREAAMRALRTLDITGMVCTSDMAGMGVTQAAKELNISIPEQLSVTGFDGVGVDLMCDPRLTTVRQPVFSIGRRLGELLIMRLKNKEKDYVFCHEEIMTDLIVRDSTARLPQP